MPTNLVPPGPIRMLDLAAQHAALQPALDEAMSIVLREAEFINGPAVAAFAQELSAALGGPHIIPCANGTDALQLALMSLDLPPGAEIILPAFTYVATAEAAAVLGLRPVVVDVLPTTFCLDPAAVEAAITPRTGAILAVHLFGQCADLEALKQISAKHYIPLIEDNAQGIGATYRFANGQQAYAGTIGEVGTTSFFPAKNLGALGDGGALFTNDAARAAFLRQLANHGQTRKYHHQHIGLNSRLDTLQAALLRVKLPHLPAWTAARQRIADYYDSALGGISGLRLPHRDKQSSHVFHQYTLALEKVPQRDQLQEYLRERGVPSMVYYPVPVHLQPAYAYLGYQAGQFPVAEHLCRTVLSLPIHPMLTEAKLNHIVTTIRAFFDSTRSLA